MLEEVFESEGGGGNTKDAMGLHTLDPLDPDIADARTVEGRVGPRCNILSIVWVELEPRVMGELKGFLIHSHHRGG